MFARLSCRVQSHRRCLHANSCSRPAALLQDVYQLVNVLWFVRQERSDANARQDRANHTGVNGRTTRFRTGLHGEARQNYESMAARQAK
jgi:hypothetical protein